MRKAIIFIATNGAGLGHLTRSMAVAKQLRNLDESLEIIFFTTSLALEVIRNQGFKFYYIPSKALMPEEVTSTVWNNMMKRQLQEIITIHHAKTLVFDGAYPYAGIIGALKEFNTLKAIWIKRETYKTGSDHYRAIETQFDTVIVPKEAGDTECMALQIGNRKYCEPIISVQKSEAYERKWIRDKMGILKNERLVYVQLGAGNINKIKETIECVIEGILKLKDYRIVIGESIIGSPLNITHPRVQTIRHYPNSLYFKGVDYAVSAAGYNTFHELIYFNIPTLFIPNQDTKKDDQLKRALWAYQAQAGFCLKEANALQVALAMNQLDKNREIFIDNMKQMLPITGEQQAAHIILQ